MCQVSTLVYPWLNYPSLFPINVSTDRHDDFIKLERAIREIHELFLEMSALVSQQDNLITNIWQNMENAQCDVESGKQHLSKAEQHQKSARKMKIILAIVLAVIILIIAIALVCEFAG